MKRKLVIALLFVPLMLVLVAGVQSAGISTRPARIGSPVEAAYPPPGDEPQPTEAAYPAPMTPEPTWILGTPEPEYPPHVYDEDGNLIWCSHTEPWCWTQIAP